MERDIEVQVVIPMAGEGSRFQAAGYNIPKPLIDIGGKPMIQWVIENLKTWDAGIRCKFIFLVREAHLQDPSYQLGQLLQNSAPGARIVPVAQLTDGPLHTVFLAKAHLDMSKPVLIANCDQFLEWDMADFIRRSLSADGAVSVFHQPDASDAKWSYVESTPNGTYAKRTREKEVISDLASTGLYFWTRASDLIKYGRQMMMKNIRVNNEFYVAPVYNEAIADGQVIKVLKCSRMWGLGVPDDVERFKKDYLGLKEPQPKRFALVLIGESFRTGAQHSRIKGEDGSSADQIEACRTHVDFIKHMKQQWNYDCDLYIHTYSTKFDQDLHDVYAAINAPIAETYLTQMCTHSMNCHVHRAVQCITGDWETYDFVWFMRIDLYLKPHLEKIVSTEQLCTKILYTSMCWIGCHKAGVYPRVNDTMLTVPKKYFDVLKRGDLTLCHDGWLNICRNAKFNDVNPEDIDLIMYTLHDSDSAKDWNPIYRIVNRGANNVWASKGLTFNRVTMSEMPVSEENNNVHVHQSTLDVYEAEYPV